MRQTARFSTISRFVHLMNRFIHLIRKGANYLCKQQICTRQIEGRFFLPVCMTFESKYENIITNIYLT